MNTALTEPSPADTDRAGTASTPEITVIARSVAAVDLGARGWLRTRYQRSGRLRWRRAAGVVELLHPFSSADISDSVVVAELSALVEQGVLVGRDEFEAAAVGLITSVVPESRTAWRSFYANSVAELQAGTAPFSPVHRRARSLIDGESVLEVGCCFGFFALQCAGAGLSVTAADICAGALTLLDDASTSSGIPVQTRLSDARALPFAENSFDTVTLLHLLEHLDPDDVPGAIAESCRVARRRVVIAVPYEEVASGHFGHLRTVCEEDLRAWATAVPCHRTTIFTDHGGWLVIDAPA